MELVIYTAMVSTCWGCLSYPTYAFQIGWPRGEILSGGASWPTICSYLGAAIGLYKSYALASWWTPIIILLVAFVFAFWVTNILREKVQILWILGCLPLAAMTLLI